MARTDTLPHFLTDIADAIREKKGTEDTITASDFDTEIANLPSGPENIKTVESVEEMNALQNVKAGDTCVIKDETPLMPWVLGETNANVFCFPDEVDISDILDDLIDEYDGSLGFNGITTNGETLINIYWENSDDEFVFNLIDYNTDDILFVKYNYSNGKYRKDKTTFRYDYDGLRKTINDYAEGVLTRKAFTINMSMGASITPLAQEFLGRFIKTKEYKPYVDGKNCIYFSPKVSIEEPFAFEGDFSITDDNDAWVNVHFLPSSDTYTISVTQDEDEFFYEYNYETGKYEGSGDLNNAVFVPTSELSMLPSSSLTEEQIQDVIDSGLFKIVANGFPTMYIYDGTNWVKLSQDGSPYEC